MNRSLVFSLLISQLLASAPHAQHLPIEVSALTLILAGWRAYLAINSKPLPPRWLLLIITLSALFMLLITHRTLFGREAGVSLLVLLGALKLLESRSLRDAMVLIYLACIIMLTQFFYSQSMVTGTATLITLFVIMAAWVQAQTDSLALQYRLRIAAALMLQAIPLMLILFILFPRIQGPLWGLPQDAYASSGLDDRMSPGSLSALSLSEAVAFRARFSGTPPAREFMYWRGPVLWDFDGLTWTPGSTADHHPAVFTRLSQPVDYTITLEPHNKTWLFVLEMPAQFSIPASITSDFRVLRPTPVTGRIRYTARSHLSHHANRDESPQQLQRALRLPATLNPRARQLAAAWRSSLRDDEKIVRAALDHFNREDFSYTLRPPRLGRHTIDEFLFGTRQGFCEHYASSFVYLMRAAGIPARVVTGYQGGEYNDVGNYFIVRQSAAHAWAEVWLRGRGWVRVDPTAAIAPERVHNGLAAAIPDIELLPFLARTQNPWLMSLRLNLDALTNQWNQWVLGYDSERQFAFLTRLGMEDVSWKTLATGMSAGIALLAGAISLLLLRRLIPRNPDPVQRQYLRFCHKLEKAGVMHAAHEGPCDLAIRASLARPGLADSIATITNLYIALRYDNKGANTSLLRALQKHISAFKS